MHPPSTRRDADLLRGLFVQLIAAALLMGFPGAQAGQGDGNLSQPASNNVAPPSAIERGSNDTTSPKGGNRLDEARVREVKPFIEGYFHSWSDGDMKAYGELFAPEAIIQFIDSQGRLVTQGRRRFLAEQREFQTVRRATEIPESIQINFEGRLARAVVFWKLTSGTTTKYGYDHFTLLKHDRKWQIINLVFYEVDRPK